MSRPIVIIGAGLGGLSAAIHLAAAGEKVILFEKNRTAGGKMGEVVADGFRFDTGPSLLTMPFVIDQLFQAAGKKREDYLRFEPVNPVCRYFFSEGSKLDAFSDLDRMVKALNNFSPGSTDEYKRFLSYSRKIYRAAADLFLFTPFQEPGALFRWKNLPALLRLPQIDARRNIHQAVSRFFHVPRLVQLFDRYATYNGSDPFRAPATLNIIPYVELGLGGFYIRGGMYRLVEALQQLAGELGVEMHFGQPVEKILVENKSVTGVRVNGQTISAGAVDCNGDVVESYRTLLPPDAPSRRKIERLEPSLSGLVFLWGVEQKHPELAHHNIFFSGDYQQEFREIFEQRKAPADPTIYISITNRCDENHAPAGGENWFVLLNMPYLHPGQDWDAEVQRLRQSTLRKLAKAGLDISGHIRHETVITPKDFHQKFGSNRGSIYGISSNSRLSAFLRPSNRSHDYRGLYFAGGSAHPGGGIPLVLLSGKMAAQLITNSKLYRKPGQSRKTGPSRQKQNTTYQHKG
ncbi:MAG: phytoene desaturase family protein [Calditrichia bacterium]